MKIKPFNLHLQKYKSFVNRAKEEGFWVDICNSCAVNIPFIKCKTGSSEEDGVSQHAKLIQVRIRTLHRQWEEERVPDRKPLVYDERLPQHSKERTCYGTEEARNKKTKTKRTK